MNVEKVIIEQFCSKINVKPNHQFNIFIKSHEKTGVGFISELKKDKSLFFPTTNFSTWSKQGITVNNEVDAGFVLYFENFYLVAVECFVYDNYWPREIFDIKFYEI